MAGLLVAGLASASLLAAPPVVASGALTDENASPVLASLDFAFKTDPRLTRSLYLGDRWASPPTFAINQPRGAASVEARVQGKDGSGQPLEVKPRWTPTDPQMVAITPAEGSEVKLAVLRAGESRILVSADGLSRELTVKALEKGETLAIEISQVPAAGTPEAEQRAKIVSGDRERRSYALGIDFGRRLRQQSAALSGELVAQGLEDALSGRAALLTEEELKAALATEQRPRVAAQPVDQRQAAEKNLKDGQAFLAANKAKEGVVTLESGLQYRVVKAGNGPRPTAEDTVVCHYRGTLIDGKEFDSSYRRKRPAQLPVKRVVKGWQEALRLMPVGSTWQLFIPPSLAYGERGTRGIGPNSTLVFQVELLSIAAGAAARGAAEPASSGPEGEKPPGR